MSTAQGVTPHPCDHPGLHKIEGPPNERMPLEANPGAPNDHTHVNRDASAPSTPLAAALEYAARGWFVFPVWEISPDGTCACSPPGQPCSKGPKSAGKHPHIKDQHEVATTDAAQIRAWWAQCPNANVGISCGKSGLVVIDVDQHRADKDGEASLAALVAEHGALPDTYVVQSGSGSSHLYFARPEGIDSIPSGNHKIAPGIDHRADNGYVIAPPSNHASGGRYTVATDAPIAPLPAWLLGAITAGKPRQASTFTAPAREPTEAERAAALWKVDVICAVQESATDGRDAFMRRAFTLGGLAWAAGEETIVERFMAANAKRPRTAKSQPVAEIERWLRAGLAAGADEPLDPCEADRIRASVEACIRRLRGWPPANDPSPPEPDPAAAKKRKTVAERIDSISESGVKLPTGFETLDRATRGGLRMRKPLVIGGAPGACKTMMTVQLAVRYLQQGIPVAIMSFDEEDRGLLTRIGQILGIGTRDQFEQGDQTIRERLKAAIADLPLLVFDSGDDDNPTLESAAEELFITYGPGVIAIDSLQAVRTEESSSATGPRERMDRVVAAIKSVRGRFGHLVIATSELNRGAYRSKSQAEQVSDMSAYKESGSIEYLFDVALLLRTPPGGDDEIEVAMPKDRLGRAEPFRLKLDRTTATMREIPMPSEEEQEAAKEGKREAKLTGLENTILNMIREANRTEQTDAKWEMRSMEDVAAALRARKSGAAHMDVCRAVRGLKTSRQLWKDPRGVFRAAPE